MALQEWSHRGSGACVTRLMFDYALLSDAEIQEICDQLPLKLIRWIGMNHPDNTLRLRFFRRTGVPIGDGTVINARLTLYDDYAGLVTFGSRVAVGTDVTIIASSSPNNSALATHPYIREHVIKTAPVRIGDDAWLGAQCVVLPGVTIGENSVVAAGAIVSRDVASRTIVAGTPARQIRTL